MHYTKSWAMRMMDSPETRAFQAGRLAHLLENDPSHDHTQFLQQAFTDLEKMERGETVSARRWTGVP